MSLTWKFVNVGGEVASFFFRYLLLLFSSSARYRVKAIDLYCCVVYRTGEIFSFWLVLARWFDQPSITERQPRHPRERRGGGGSFLLNGREVAKINETIPLSWKVASFDFCCFCGWCSCCCCCWCWWVDANKIDKSVYHTKRVMAWEKQGKIGGFLLASV